MSAWEHSIHRRKRIAVQPRARLGRLLGKFASEPSSSTDTLAGGDELLRKGAHLCSLVGWARFVPLRLAKKESPVPISCIKYGKSKSRANKEKHGHKRALGACRFVSSMCHVLLAIFIALCTREKKGMKKAELPV